MSRPHAASRGFTLIELLVAIAVMALMAILSWRGLDGMHRAQTQTQARADEVLVWQAGLAQWKADLDALIEVPQIKSLEWDGRVLRLTRRGMAAAGDGLRVVAWTRRADAGGSWLRWQSPALATRDDWNRAWVQAERWGQNPGDEEKKREVAILPLEDWQLFYFRSNAWSNPLSSDGTTATPGQTTLPEGIRSVLTLAPGQAFSGRLTLDWVRPTVGGGKS
jgi:general secretion pathway protein J